MVLTRGASGIRVRATVAIRVVGRPHLPCPGPIIFRLASVGHILMMLAKILRGKYTILISGVSIGLRQAGTLKLLVLWNVHIFLDYFFTEVHSKPNIEFLNSSIQKQ